MTRNVLMYGGPPIDPWHVPQDILPIAPVFLPRQQWEIAPIVTPSKDSIIRDLVKRIDELRAIIALADAHREELATLERMLAATQLEPTPKEAP